MFKEVVKAIGIDEGLSVAKIERSEQQPMSDSRFTFIVKHISFAVSVVAVAIMVIVADYKKLVALLIFAALALFFRAVFKDL